MRRGRDRIRRLAALIDAAVACMGLFGVDGTIPSVVSCRCSVLVLSADHWYSAGLRCWSGRRGDAVVSARADWIRFRSVFSDSVRAARPLARPPARPVIRVPAVLTQMTAKLPRRNVIATASRISNTYGEGNRERTTYGRRTINCAAPSVPDTDLHACHAGSDGVPRIPIIRTGR